MSIQYSYDESHLERATRPRNDPSAGNQQVFSKITSHLPSVCGHKVSGQASRWHWQSQRKEVYVPATKLDLFAREAIVHGKLGVPFLRGNFRLFFEGLTWTRRLQLEIW